MKKLLRYWWVLVVGLVVLPRVTVLSRVSHGDDWTTSWCWLTPTQMV